MRVVMLILIIAMIAKDASQINDPYIMRGIAQGLCFVVGMIWMLMNANFALLKRYWPIFGYLFASFISGLLSPRMGFALLQSVSLAAVLLFSIAYFESQSKKQGDSTNLFFYTTIIAYTVICIISIVLIKLNHSIVFSRVGDWSDQQFGLRFSGLFPVSGMMGAAAGLLIGFVLFKRIKWWLRWPGLASGLICLMLTQSRTFWVATFVTSILVWWVYKPKARKVLVAVTLGTALVVGSLMILNVTIDTSDVEKEARIGSLSTLSGRLPLWENGLKVFWKSPLIGYGSTMGSYAFRDNAGSSLKNIDDRSARSMGTDTLHNGYLQSILDLGVLGLFFYIAIFITALRRGYRYDKSRTYGAAVYGVLFMVIGNMGESIVYSASVSHSIVFWVVVIFALHQFRPATLDVIEDKEESVSDNNPEPDMVPPRKHALLRASKREQI